MIVQNKTALITGANNGLGFFVCKRMAAQGYQIIMACRNKERGEAAREEIQKNYPKANLSLEIVDLSSFSSLRYFLKLITEKYEKIDIIYNNAAIMKMDKQQTCDGFDIMFQTNCLGPVILMNGLKCLLEKSSNPLIINIAAVEDKYPLHMDDLEAREINKPIYAMMHSKLCLGIYSLYLSQKISAWHIPIVTIDGTSIKSPGAMIKSDFRRDLPQMLNWFLNLFAVKPEICAETVLYFVESKNYKELNGKVFSGIKELILQWTKDMETMEKLYTKVNKILKTSFDQKFSTQ